MPLLMLRLCCKSLPRVFNGLQAGAVAPCNKRATRMAENGPILLWDRQPVRPSIQHRIQGFLDSATLHLTQIIPDSPRNHRVHLPHPTLRSLRQQRPGPEHHDHPAAAPRRVARRGAGRRRRQAGRGAGQPHPAPAMPLLQRDHDRHRNLRTRSDIPIPGAASQERSMTGRGSTDVIHTRQHSITRSNGSEIPCINGGIHT